MKLLTIPYISSQYDINKKLKIKLDDEWFNKLKDKKFSVSYKGYGYYFMFYEQGKYFYLHRLIVGAGNRETVDHINRDTLDCQSKNLRVVTHQQNLRNRGKQRNNKSGYKGVYKATGSKLFSAKIQDGEHSWQSHGYKTAKEASEAYNKLANLLFS